MKKIEALIEPSKVDEVKDGLNGMGIGAMTVTEVKGFGGRKGAPQVYRGQKYEAPYICEAKVEIIVADEMMDSAIAMIQERAKTGEPEETQIFVFPLESRVKRPLAVKTA